MADEKTHGGRGDGPKDPYFAAVALAADRGPDCYFRASASQFSWVIYSVPLSPGGVSRSWLEAPGSRALLAGGAAFARPEPG